MIRILNQIDFGLKVSNINKMQLFKDSWNNLIKQFASQAFVTAG